MRPASTRAGSYAFDQNSLDWTGNVLLFSQTQLTPTRPPIQTRTCASLAIEDDDGACQIRLDGNRFKTFQTTLQTNYPNLTGGKDSTSGLTRIFKRANALQKILRAAYSWITSQDDLIGNAIEDCGRRRVPRRRQLGRPRREQRDQRLAQTPDAVILMPGLAPARRSSPVVLAGRIRPHRPMGGRDGHRAPRFSGGAVEPPLGGRSGLTGRRCGRSESTRSDAAWAWGCGSTMRRRAWRSRVRTPWPQ